MTEPAPLPFDPAMARALDRFDVPPPGAGFLDRIAAMPADDAPALPPLPRRRLFAPGRRGAWMRRASIGVIALGIASATAATTGVFPKLRQILPAPVVAMLSPSPRPKPVHRHTEHEPALDAQVPTAPVNPGSASPWAAADPDSPLQRFLRREERVDIIQQRLSARGFDVPKPVIRRELTMRQIAVGAAIRGDSTTPLPPRMAAMRNRASAFLDNHPQLRDRLRERAAAVDAHRQQAVAAARKAPPPGATPPAATAPAPAQGTTGEAAPGTFDPAWTERRMRLFRRMQMLRQYWAAQRQAAAPGATPAQGAAPAQQGDSAQNITTGEGNSGEPR